MNKFSYLLFLLAMAALMACEKKLDTSPRSSLDPDNVNAEDAEALLTGCYDGVQGGAYRHFWLSYLTDDNSADNLVWKRFWQQHQEIDDNNIQTNNTMIARWWSGYYITINRCNNLIKAIVNVDVDIQLVS